MQKDDVHKRVLIQDTNAVSVFPLMSSLKLIPQCNNKARVRHTYNRLDEVLKVNASLSGRRVRGGGRVVAGARSVV